MKRKKSWIVWIESREGTFYPVQFKTPKKGVTKTELEKLIRKKVPHCGQIIFVKRKAT